MPKYRRTPLECRLAILRLMKESESGVTRLMYSSSLSWDVLHSNLDFLEQRGLVKQTDVPYGQSHRNKTRRIYSLTKDGREALSLIERALELFGVEQTYPSKTKKNIVEELKRY